MKAYSDITLLPDSDIGHHFIWQKVYQQLHLALVENKNADGLSPYGIAFPQYDLENRARALGYKLRVFSPDKSALEKLDLSKWLDRLYDYVHVGRIKEVPVSPDSYVRFSRVHEKPSRERLARRAVKRHAIDYQAALRERSNYPSSPVLEMPYIQMNSLGNNNRFCLFIKKEVVTAPEEVLGAYSTYGLSKGGVLPYF